MATATMFAACRCGEQILQVGPTHSSVYYTVRDWQKQHEALGHQLIDCVGHEEEYYRLYGQALKK